MNVHWGGDGGEEKKQLTAAYDTEVNAHRGSRWRLGLGQNFTTSSVHKHHAEVLASGEIESANQSANQSAQLSPFDHPLYHHQPTT